MRKTKNIKIKINSKEILITTTIETSLFLAKEYPSACLLYCIGTINIKPAFAEKLFLGQVIIIQLKLVAVYCE